MEQMGWTIDELATRVAAALDDAAYPGAPNGRVRDVPDPRSIRWYSTIGLVDRPSGMRGRTALYGPRHLLQLVAIKRLQAQGQRIADIQAVLTGAPDDVLSDIARVPGMELDEPVPFEPGRPRFWAEPPAPALERKPEFVHEHVADELVRTAVAHRRAARGLGTLTGVNLNGLHLGGGAVLLLPSTAQPDDVDAIMAAARPLLDVLADRGLLAE
jgi:DNA-binding transcriptional MerR regulator